MSQPYGPQPGQPYPQPGQPAPPPAGYGPEQGAQQPYPTSGPLPQQYPGSGPFPQPDHPQPNHPQQSYPHGHAPGYPQQPAHPQQQGHPLAYPQQPGYPGQPGYPQPGGYAQPGMPQQPLPGRAAPGQPMGPAMAPPPAGMGRIVLDSSYPGLAFGLGLFKPGITINGQPGPPATWGKNVIDLPPGQHRIEVHVKYLWKFGSATAVVPVNAGQQVDVFYRSPMVAFGAGAIGPVPQQTPNLGLAIGLTILGCVIGLLIGMLVPTLLV